MLKRDEWQAMWIWRSREIVANDFAYFRKEWTARSTVASAELRVSAHHTASVYVNGSRLCGYGTPAPTTPWKRKYYVAYDVSGLLQDEGVNCLTADAHYLGGSGQNYVDGRPAFRLELHVTYADGSEELVATDETWQSLTEPPYTVGTPYQQRRRISAIGIFDARNWDASWRLPGWSGGLPVQAAVPAHVGVDEWPMEPQPIPEGQIEEVISPIAVTEQSHGQAVQEAEVKQQANGPGEEAEEAEEAGFGPQLFDVGKIISGWPRISLPGVQGVTVRLRYSEAIERRGGRLRVKHNVANEKSSCYYDEYRMRGDALETWQPDFSYKAFRYVEVTGYPERIEPGSDLVICSAHTDLAHTGSFRCSDDLLNAMYAAIVQTQKNNSLGQFVDCPHREQAQYLADTDLQAEALLYNFDGAAAMLEKTLSDFADMQLPDGTFPFNAPSNYAHKDFHIQIPEWDLHFATLLWKLYEYSGDEALLHRYFQPLSRMIDYYVGVIKPETGLVPLDKGWHISDWPYPSVDKKGDHLTVQQMKLATALDTARDAAALIGDDEAHRRYGEQGEALRRAIADALYDSELRRYRDSSGSERTHQGVNGYALWGGFVPLDHRDDVAAYVAESPWESRTVLSLPLLRAMFEHGREAEAFELIRRADYPGWGYMIAQGATTMWEGWDDIESHSHAWNGYPARLLQEYVVGIRSAAPGFASVIIRPSVPEGLDYAEASVCTPHGVVFARWEKRADVDRNREGVGTGDGERMVVAIRVRLPLGMTGTILWREGAAAVDAAGEERRLFVEAGETEWVVPL